MTGLRSKKLIAALTLGLLLAACGDSPEKMMGSARAYLAKGDVNAATIQLKNVLQKKPELAEARFLFGQILLDGGDAVGAEKELRKALASGQSRESVLPLLSRAMLSQGKAKEWISELGAVPATTPALRAIVAVAESEAWMQERQIPKAEVAAREALKIEPANAGALLTLARIDANNKDFPAALQRVESVLAKDAKSSDALSLRAEINLFKGEIDKALVDIDELIRLKPRNLQPRLHKVQILMMRGKLDEAEAVLGEARKVMPGNLQIRLAEGMIALNRNKNEEARDAARQVLKVNPGFVPALIIEGTALYRLKDYVNAQTELELALGKAPRAEEARRVLARAYLAGRDAERALETIQPLLDREPADHQAFLIAGQAALQAGDLEHSKQFFAKASAADPKDPAARARMGVVRLMEGDVDAGVHELESAAALAPDSSETVIALVMTYLHEGRLDKAQAAAEGLTRRTPKNPAAYNVLGAVRIHARDSAGARVAFEKAQQLDPSFLPAVGNLARLDLAQGRPDQAKARFQSLLAKDPKNTGASLGLVRLLVQIQAKPEEIRKVLETAITANATAIEPRLALVELLARGSDKKAAQAAANELVSAFPRDAKALAMAGAVLLQSGDTQQGLNMLQKVVQIKPRSAGALILLSDGQMAMKDLTGAEQSLRKAIAVEPQSPVEASRRLFGLKMAQRKFDDAVQIARDLQMKKPRESVGFFLEGEAKAVAKDWNAAAAAYAKALDLSKDGLIAVRLDNALQQAGKTKEVGSLRADWSRSHPKDVVFPAYLAERALMASNYPEAARIYKGLIEVEPKNALILNNLAWVAGQLKDPKAISYVDRALALAPNAPSALDTKAGLLDAGGQSAPAQELWRRAVSLAPNNGEIRLNLARSLIRTGNRSGARTELDKLMQSAAQNSPQRQEAEKLLRTL